MADDDLTPGPAPEDPLDARFNALRTDVQGQFNNFGYQLVSALKGEIDGLKQTMNPKAEASDEVAAAQRALLENPGEFVKAQARAVAEETMRGVTGAMVADKFEAFMERQQAAFDDKYGAGSWNEEMDKDVRSVAERLSQTDPEKLASERYLELLVNGVKGMKEDKLFEKRSERTKVQDEERRRAPNLLTGSRMPREKGDSLSSDQKEYLAEMARSGIMVDSKSYLRDMMAGNTEDDFPAEDKK